MVSIGDGASAPPPPSDATALDFELPEELIQDAVGRILCVVCKVYVPRGQMNASQHLGGKKHATQAQRVPRDVRAQRRAELVEKFAKERAAAGMPPLPQSTTVPVSETTRTLEKLASVGSGNQHTKGGRPGDSGVPEEQGDSGTGIGVASKRSQRIGLLKALSIDRTEFLSSVLESDADSGSESTTSEAVASLERIGTNEMAANEMAGSGQDNTCSAAGPVSDGTPHRSVGEGTDTLAGRSVAFGPVRYKAPEGAADFFMESMAGEVSSTDRAQGMREILAVKPKVPASSGQRVAPRDIDDDAGTGFLSLECPPLDDDAELSSARTASKGKSEANGTFAAPSGSEVPKHSSDSDIESSPDALPPWLVGEDAIEAVQCNPDASVALHYEILEFERFMSPTKEEEIVRRDLVQTVTAIVQAIWPAARVEVFGSYATDLYLPTSDIDMCVLDTPEGGGSPPHYSEHLELAQAIRNVKSFARRVNFIKARVPLVKIVSRTSNVQCDISFNRGNGPANVPVIKNYLSQFPALRPLLMVLKCFLQQRSLNEVFSGGLGSYSLLLLVVSHLQMSQYNFPGSKANLGTALHQFFQLYGRLFNYCLTGIRVKEDGAYFDKAAKYNTTPGETLRYCIEDPNDETNELGRSSYASSRIRKAFGNASMFLSNWRRDDPSAPVTPLSAILHLEDDFRERRAKLVEDFTNRNLLKLFDWMKARREERAQCMNLAGDEVDITDGTGGGGSSLRRVVPGQLDVMQADYRGLASNGRGRAPTREPTSKRRRGDAHREYDGGLGQQQRSSRQGMHGSSGGMGNMNDSQGANMYGQQMPQMLSAGDQYTASYDVMNVSGAQGVPLTGGHVYGAMSSGMAPMSVDPYSGFAPDPMQLAQMQGLQYGAGHMTGWNNAGMSGHHQQYDPRFAQGGANADFAQGAVPGQSWRHSQHGTRGIASGPGRGRPMRGGGRGGSRGSSRGRGRRGR